MIEVRCHYSRGTETYKLREQTSKQRGNYRWSYDSTFGLLTDPLALDLIEIAKAVHMADRLFRRSEGLGAQRRRLSVRVPVRRVRTWSAASELLEDIASFVSEDLWHIKFTKLDERSPRKTRTVKTSKINSRRSAVGLFSGGLDSLCGAAHLYSEGFTPVFVTHSPPGRKRVRTVMRDLASRIGRSDLAEETQFVSFRLHLLERDETGVRAMFQEPTRRTRPLFFLSLAGAVALDTGVETIRMSENGALAVNIPLRNDAYGAMCARQAHAEALRKFERLLKKVCPAHQGLRVVNPFFDMTKGEAARLLGKARRLAPGTESCEYTGKQAATLRNWRKLHRKGRSMIGTGPQCGLCIPCIVRRAALRQAEIRELNSQYFFNARKLLPAQSVKKNRVPLYDFISHNVPYMLRFCTRINKMTFREFFTQYFPELWRSADHERFAKECIRIHRLQRRFSGEVGRFLRLK